MEYVIYDIVEERVAYRLNEQFLGHLANNHVQLKYVDTAVPEHDEAIEKIEVSYAVDLALKTYTRVHTVVDKTEQEKQEYQNNLNWPEKEWGMRISISIVAIMSNSQLQQFVSQLLLWWQMTGLIHVYRNERVSFYCNFIHQEHQAIVDAFGPYIDTETSPWL